MQEFVSADRRRVCATLPSFADANFRQSWAYADLAARRVGGASEWFELREGADSIALANVRIKRLPLGLGGIALLSGGPLVRHLSAACGSDPAESLRRMLRLLVEEFVRRRGLKLRVQAAPGCPDWNRQQEAVLADCGFALASQARPYRTILKSIEGDEDDLRRSLEQKWRNQLNAASRQGFTVEAGSTPALFERFSPLFGSTQSGKGFSVDLDAGFFSRVGGATEAGEPTPWVTIVSHEGRDVSGHLGMYMGDTGVYLLGGTTDEGRRLKAAYWAQWQAILHARSVGCSWYDLGGIDPEGNPGVFHFKEGLKGIDLLAPPPVELGSGGLRGIFTEWAEAFVIRRRTRRSAPA